MNFGLCWAKVASSGEFLGPSVECKVLEKSVSHPRYIQNKPSGWSLASLRMGGIHFSLIQSTEGPRNSPFGVTLAQNRSKITKNCQNPPFARFLMCASIIFLWVAAQGPKRSFFNPKLGTRLKKHGFEGSQVHPQKVYRRTHSEEGAPGSPGVG